MTAPESTGVTNLPVVVVTGGNRGIDFEVCRQLFEASYRVVLGSRDAQREQAAIGTTGSFCTACRPVGRRPARGTKAQLAGGQAAAGRRSPGGSACREIGRRVSIGRAARLDGAGTCEMVRRDRSPSERSPRSCMRRPRRCSHAHRERMKRPVPRGRDLPDMRLVLRCWPSTSRASRPARRELRAGRVLDTAGISL